MGTQIVVIPKRGMASRFWRALGRGARRLIYQLIRWGIWRPVRRAAIWAARAARWVLWESTRGPQRAMWAPAWFLLAAALPLPYSVWLVVAAALDAPNLPRWAVVVDSFRAGYGLPRLHRKPRVIRSRRRDVEPAVIAVKPAKRRWWNRRWLSARERELVGRACALVAGWHLAAPGMQARGSALLLAVLVAGCSVPWWRWRWTPKGADPELVTIWEGIVVPAYEDEASGKWRDVTPREDGVTTGVLRLHSGTGDELAGKTAEITALLDERLPFDLPRNALRIETPDTLPSARDVQVTFMPRPRAALARTRYFEEPTLDETGAFRAGQTIGGREVHLRVFRSGGANNILALGGPGCGKGGLFRLIVLNLSAFGTLRDEDGRITRHGAMTWYFDGKYGQGGPENAGAVDFYLSSPEEWEIGLNCLHELRDVRVARYAKEKRPRWSIRADPLLAAVYDELTEIARRVSSRHDGEMERHAAQDRSIGIGHYANTQRGAGENMFSTTFRANLRANGIILVGKQGDTTAGMLAAMDTMFDLTKIPAHPGYWLPISNVDSGIPLDIFRADYIVSEQEVVEDGEDPGPDIVENWAKKLRQDATPHEQDLEVISRWMERLGRTVPGLSTTVNESAAAEETGTPWYDMPPGAVPARTAETPAWGTPPTQVAVAERRNPTRDAVLAFLPEVGYVTVEQVADHIGRVEKTARNILNDLEAEELAVKDGRARWRKKS